ncbi:single-stranded DNA-binding protein, mitochondrial [Amaranthus tricolor]|uniref:single-stranded DNA-binding protein, mitochondrial n=1 Tax=Amaranthus tricolor TaxID=29722 RepID=UPI00258B6776|nr:single-stranded DNA-binding protein, mitochondrial [Amaranthus tricolor]
MATSNSLAAISRTLCRTLLSNQKPLCYHQRTTNFFFSNGPSTTEYSSDSSPNEFRALNSDTETSESPPTRLGSFTSDSSSTYSESTTQRSASHLVFEEGLDIGIYKAILVGQVGQTPLQKRLKNGKSMTLTTIGTGGIRNERIPFPNEEPREYADRCNVQWHRVAIYVEKLGDLLVKHAQPGSILYLEGNLETKVFTDQVTGLVKRVREIAIRRNGRIVFLGNGGDFSLPSVNELKGVGYF